MTKVEPTRAELEALFTYTEEEFFDGERTYRGGFLWRPETWAKRRVVRDRVERFGVAFAGGFYRHPASGLEYPVIGTKFGYFLTHRLVWSWHYGPIPPGIEIDHIDRDTFHSRIGNLRDGTSESNRKNRSARAGSSRFVGVYWQREQRAWVAQVKDKGRTVRVGIYGDEVRAALARDRAAREMYGPFANLNFPQRIEDHEALI